MLHLTQIGASVHFRHLRDEPIRFENPLVISGNVASGQGPLISGKCMNRPKVSLGVPVYNGQQYLEYALRSLVEQTFGDFELILCDNASTDRTADICREFAA